MKKVLTGSVVAGLIGIAGVLFSTVPAHADQSDSCEAKDGKPAHDPASITVCVYTEIYSPNAATHAYVAIGPKWGTAATGCNLTSYLLLGASPQGDKWESPRHTVSCDDALVRRGYPSGPSQSSTGTSAHWAQGVACVDLYWNHQKSHSGWQWCSYGIPRLG